MTRVITSESGSRYNAISGRNPATSIQDQRSWAYALFTGGALKNETETTMAMTAEMAMDNTPTAATVLRGKRPPIKRSSAALANGTAGISQRRSSMSAFHPARGIGVQRLVPV